MLTDLRLALRQLAKARSFAFIATLTLAVGIGSSTAMFSALRALVVHPFDYPASDRIVQVWSGNGWPLSPADFLDQHDQTTSFEHFGVYAPGTVNVGLESAQAVPGVRATAGVLPAFGVAAWRGRVLTEEDCREGAAKVAVISHRLWQQSFGSDATLIGRTIRLNGADVTVIGIMPPDFEFAAPWMRTEDCQVWLPHSFTDKERTQRELLNGRHPERVVENAVRRMLPRGPLFRQQLSNLRVYAGAEHRHEAQQPVKIDIASMNSKNVKVD